MKLPKRTRPKGPDVTRDRSGHDTALQRHDPSRARDMEGPFFDRRSAMATGLAAGIGLFSLGVAAGAANGARPEGVDRGGDEVSDQSAQHDNDRVSGEDAASLRAAALDYIQGFYTADAQRMERAIHPELAKRILRRDPSSGRERLDQMSALTLIHNTRAAAGRFPPDSRCDVTILDRFENAACVRVDAATWVDFLQLTKTGGQWKIVNVLWELRPESSPAR